MVRTLWELPVAPTALLNDPGFVVLKGRQCELSLSYEGEDDDSMVLVSLLFQGVECFKCTYLSSCSVMCNQAYGRVIDLGETPWLTEVLPSYLAFRRSYDRAPEELHHLMIYFDDGPCYEFICAEFRESSITRPYSVQ